MRKFYQLITPIALATILVACGGETETENPNLEEKKARLDSLKGEFTSLKAEIDKLEGEIAKLDPSLKSNDILVTTLVPGKKEFQHIVQLRGSVQSRHNVMLSAETMGVVKTLKAREGMRVSKGDLLLALDGQILASSIREVETQLELAEVVYERQKKLWDQKIGTEIQYLEAKNNYEALKTKKSTLQAQLSQTRVRAPFSGTIDQVNVKIGEMVQPGMPLVRLVNPSEMHIMADVSEEFLGMFEVGDPVTITFPDREGEYKSKVRSVSNVLNTNNRTFQMEVSLPKSTDFKFRPNQVAIVNIADYKADSAVIVPTKVILAGREGKFVYVVEKNGAKDVAKKRIIRVGKSDDLMTEVVAGLSGEEEVITKGYREVSDGTAVRKEEEKQVASK